MGIIYGLSVTNTFPEYTSIEISKAWKDADGNTVDESKTPEAIDAVLYQNGRYYRTVELTKEKNWTITVDNLPIQSGGNWNTYTVGELDDDGNEMSTGIAGKIDGNYYIFSVDGTMITNQQYKATGSAILNIQKFLEVTGKSEEDSRFEADDFKFKATKVDAEGNNITDNDGYTVYQFITKEVSEDKMFETTASLTLNYVEEYGRHDIGTHRYKIEEIKDDSVIGMDYSEAVYYATVVVTDAGNGTLSTSVTYQDKEGNDLASDVTPSFTNIDRATYKLPETGGTGTGMYTVGGLICILAAGFILLLNKMKHRKA